MEEDQAVTSDLDVYRAAQSLLERHGEDAPTRDATKP